MAEGGEGVLISGELLVNGRQAIACLTAEGRLEWKGKSSGCLVMDSDVLGFTVEGSAIRIKVFVMQERRACCGEKGVKRTRKDVVLELLSVDSAGIWSEKIKGCLDVLGRPKRLLIMINPFSGKKSALKTFRKEVEPLLVAADIQYTVQETQYQLHAKEIASSLDVSKYDGLVCVSGDGILVEVVNGLFQRKDWASAIKMPIGVVPAGTGNGMAKSLLDSANESCVASNATFAVIRGHKRSLDVATVLQGETRFFSVLLLTWGIVADIDIESEKYRWMGSARIDVYSIIRIARLRKYHGSVSFVPVSGYESYGDPLIAKEKYGSILRNLNGNHSQGSTVSQDAYLGPICHFEAQDWRTLEGPFILVWLNNVPWAGQTAQPAPKAMFSDGCLDLVLIKDCPLPALLSAFLKLSEGGHVHSPHVLYLKVKAVCLEPGQQLGQPDKGGIIDVDGEVLARGEKTFKCGEQDLMAYGPPIYMTVDKGLATVFTP